MVCFNERYGQLIKGDIVTARITPHTHLDRRPIDLYGCRWVARTRVGPIDSSIIVLIWFATSETRLEPIHAQCPAHTDSFA